MLQAPTPRPPGGELVESDDEWQASVLAAAAAAAEQAVPVPCTPSATAAAAAGDETPVARSMAPNPTPNDQVCRNGPCHRTLDLCRCRDRRDTGGWI
jgi:hypothetical protein